MSDPVILEQLNEIFWDVFDDDSIRVHETMTAADIEEWDSLNHINLIVAVEKRFRIKFTTREIMTYANVGQFVRAIEDKVGAVSGS